MPPDVSVAPSMPAVSSLPQLSPQTSSTGNGAAQVVPAAFGSELAKALAVPTQPGQPAAATDTAAASPAGLAAQPPAPTPQETSAAAPQPAADTPAAPASPATSQATTVASSSPQLPVVPVPSPTEAPVVSTPPTAETAPSASDDTATGKKASARDTTAVRRTASACCSAPDADRSATGCADRRIVAARCRCCRRRHAGRCETRRVAGACRDARGELRCQTRDGHAGRGEERGCQRRRRLPAADDPAGAGPAGDRARPAGQSVIGRAGSWRVAGADGAGATGRRTGHDATRVLDGARTPLHPPSSSRRHWCRSDMRRMARNV